MTALSHLHKADTDKFNKIKEERTKKLKAEGKSDAQVAEELKREGF